MFSCNDAVNAIGNELLSLGFTYTGEGSSFVRNGRGGTGVYVQFPAVTAANAESYSQITRERFKGFGANSYARYAGFLFVLLDAEGAFADESSAGGARRTIYDLYIYLRKQGVVCEFEAVDLRTGTVSNIGGGSEADRKVINALQKVAAQSAAFEGNGTDQARYQNLTQPQIRRENTTGYDETGAGNADAGGGRSEKFFNVRDFGSSNMIIVYILIGLCVAAFIYDEYSLIKNGYYLLQTWGIQDNELIRQGQWWRLFTPMFLHGGFAHILGNMMSLLYLGRVVSKNYTKLEFLAIYFISGFAGNLLSFFFLGNALSLGASGAIMGLGGAMIFLITLSRNRQYYRRAGNYASLAGIVVFNLFYGIIAAGGNVNNFAHFGGFIAGFLIAWIIEAIETKKSECEM